MAHVAAPLSRAVVIGGGFFGLYLAESLARRFETVVLFEQQPACMQRASYTNQARVHNGYHYPRSVLTALRSRVNFPRFVQEFPSAIVASFEKVYAVARGLSKVTAEQFRGNMERIGAPIRPAPKRISELFNPTHIEAAFLVEEYAFNTDVLRSVMTERADRAGVEIRLRTTVDAVRPAGAGVAVMYTSPADSGAMHADHVFCCAYSQINGPGIGGGLPPVHVTHELAEMALVETPAVLHGLGITVMDGPFFSLMPFPARGLHTLSHVRYTPHARWHEGEGPYTPAYRLFDAAEKTSAFTHMARDASRYLPAISGCRHRESIWEVKTILPRSETDDSRPILFRPHHGIPHYHLVMGGKIDNVYDALDVIDQALGWERA
jgi:glycine/D-amino acid oxidase-like deaminating enzyme